MATILYTTTDAIRAAVGIASSEVSDDMLVDQQLELQVKTSLYQWLPTYATLYTDGLAVDATAEDVQIKDLLVLYCLYFGAIRVVEMVMAMRKRVTDGKQEVERFDVNWKDLLEALKARLEEVTGALDALLDLSDGGTAYFGKASPGYDPVTNT